MELKIGPQPDEAKIVIVRKEQPKERHHKWGKPKLGYKQAEPKNRPGHNKRSKIIAKERRS